MSLVKDHFWMFGHMEGSHTNNDKVLKQWGLPGPSRITPTEACHYMGVKNCIMVVYCDKPEPPFHQEALAMSSLDKVVWSVVGDAGSTRTQYGASDLEEVLTSADEYPNICGTIMDDLFLEKGARQTPETLSEFHRQLREFRKHPLDLWVVVYDHHWEGADNINDYLSHCDVLTYWTWKGSNLVSLENNFDKFVKASPGKRRVLGCYMWNYGEKKSMDIKQMEHQCNLGLKWLKEGTIEGMIFLATCICDLDLETVEWTRKWIEQVGNEELMITEETTK